MGYIGRKPTPAALTSSDIAADVITAAKIADDAISEEHLDATVITGLTALGATPADTDELIVSDAGTLKRMDYSYIKASPGMTLLTSGDITSTTSSFTINSTYVTSTYDHYMLILRGKAAGDGIQMNLRYRNSADNANIESGYSYRVGSIADNGSGANSDSASEVRLTQDHSGSNSNEGFNMVMHFLSPLSTLVPTSCHWTINNADTGDGFQSMHGMSRRNDGTEAHTGFIVYFGSGGDFANGTNYEFYGFKK